MISAGGDIPIRISGTEFFRKARVVFGMIKDICQIAVSTLSMDSNGTLRVNF